MMGSHTISKDTERKIREIKHDKEIAARAGEIWGWETPAGQFRVLRRVELLKTLASLQPNNRVLELGCGTGIFTEKLDNFDIQLTSIDLSEELLNQAKKRLKKAHAQLMVQDAEKTNLPDQFFDAVVGISILHHLNIDRALQEIFRVLKPGGRMAFTEPNFMNPQVFLERKVPFLRHLSGTSPDETAFLRWGLKHKLIQCGFRDVIVKPFDFLHPKTPRPLIPLIQNIGNICEKLPLICEIAGTLMIRGLKK